jgi:hypothetical protein
VRKRYPILAALTLAACAAPATLVNIHTKGASVAKEKVLVAEFQEIRRFSQRSHIRFRVTGGGSVSSSMFPLLGLCRVLAAHRGDYAAYIAPYERNESFQHAIIKADAEAWVHMDVLVDTNKEYLARRIPNARLSFIGDLDVSNSTPGVTRKTCQLMQWSD